MLTANIGKIYESTSFGHCWLKAWESSYVLSLSICSLNSVTFMFSFCDVTKVNWIDYAPSGLQGLTLTNLGSLGSDTGLVAGSKGDLLIRPCGSHYMSYSV